MLPQYFEKIVI